MRGDDGWQVLPIELSLFGQIVTEAVEPMCSSQEGPVGEGERLGRLIRRASRRWSGGLEVKAEAPGGLTGRAGRCQAGCRGEGGKEFCEGKDGEKVDEWCVVSGGGGLPKPAQACSACKPPRLAGR